MILFLHYHNITAAVLLLTHTHRQLQTYTRADTQTYREQLTHDVMLSFCLIINLYRSLSAVLSRRLHIRLITTSTTTTTSAAV